MLVLVCVSWLRPEVWSNLPVVAPDTVRPFSFAFRRGGGVGRHVPEALVELHLPMSALEVSVGFVCMFAFLRGHLCGDFVVAVFCSGEFSLGGAA